jgi:tRNA G18 (ribose-2'-O)-methylase SpoU
MRLMFESVGADDPRLAPYRNVSDRELLRSSGLFVAEGRLVVRRVIEDHRYRIASIVVNDAARQDLADALERVNSTVPLFVAEARALEELTGYHVHRGCLALVERPPLPPIDDVVAREGALVVVEGVTNADNVGGIFRNAAAFGAAGVVISPTCCDPFYRKAVRTSMGAVLQVPFARADSWPAGLALIKRAGRRLVALTPRAPSESIVELARSHDVSRIALVAGTEGEGLSAAAQDAADARVRIPMDGGTDSLNVAVAVGIALYALSTDRLERKASAERSPRAPSLG